MTASRLALQHAHFLMQVLLQVALAGSHHSSHWEVHTWCQVCHSTREHCTNSSRWRLAG
jgi:hypothetical protein